MDSKKYIESGILENYVLGLVTEQERIEVEQYAQKYPEVKKELNAIEDTLINYAQLHQVVPPAHLKAKVLQKIEGLNTISNVAPKSTGINNILLASVGILLLLSGLAAIYFYGQSSSKEEQLSELGQEYAHAQTLCDSIKTQNQLLTQQNQGLEELVVFLRNKATKVTIMAGTPANPNPDAIAEVNWNPETKQAFIDIGSLPKPPSGKQYQLWAIVDGKPTDMEVVDLSAAPGALIKVPFIENPQAFAITLEPEGGSVNPTLDQMYVVGNVVVG